MEIIKIGNDALKITLKAPEASTYKLNAKEIDYSDSQIKESFNTILNIANNEVGFDLNGGKMFVQLYSSKDGGCEIFVSRIDMGEEMYKDKMIVAQDVKKNRFISSVYRFDSLEKILYACRRLQDINYLGKNSIYYDAEKENYYLILDDIIPRELKYVFLNEYAKQLKGLSAVYIKEHFKCICKKEGVKTFSNLL